MNIDYFSVLGNGKINEEIIQIVQDKLLLKYDESFECVKIGRRIGTPDNDSASVICHPTANNKLLFTAVLNVDRVTFHDDYFIRNIAYELEESIAEKYKEVGIENISRIKFLAEKPVFKKIDLKEWIKKEKNPKILVTVYLKGKNHKKESSEIFQRIEEEYSLKLRGNIMELEEDNFNQLNEILENIPGNMNYTVPKDRIGNQYRVEEV